jgi:uracil-DNA glycosylase family 4
VEPAEPPAGSGLHAPLLPHPVTGRPFPSPVPPGTGWPDDPADAGTLVATTPAAVRRQAAAAAALRELQAGISLCRACPRLVTWREDVAVTKRASFADQPYWGRPVPGWGAEVPRILVVGLAPAAQGGNRTGRVFTGDRSGDWLFASLHRVGLANQPTSEHAGDGLELHGVRILAAVRCAPPANKPTTEERDTCAPWLGAELSLALPSVRAVVALGGFGWEAALKALVARGYASPTPRPKFGHGSQAILRRTPGSDGSGADEVVLLGCYHPSQQNTFTGRLTEPMLDDVLGTAARIGLAG